MRQKLGGFLFFCFVFIASLVLANFIAMRYYDKPLVAMLRDLLFLATRK